MREIRGDAKNVRSLLANTKYGIDYYQREYRWQHTQVDQLWNDLERVFERSRRRYRGSRDVSRYERYFLGAIIVSETADARFIVDGQQRLTTVTLILIALYRRLADDQQRSALAQLIYSWHAGRESLNLQVDDRDACMNALYHGREPSADEVAGSESAANLVRQQRRLEEHLDGIQRGDEAHEKGQVGFSDPEWLAAFADWLIESVYFVEVTASADTDAYAIFETMNDRGLSLTPVDMLKSYLLSRIDDRKTRVEVNETWKRTVAELRDLDDHAPAGAIKCWLRSQYMEPSGATEAGEADRDRIDSEFHHWVRENEGRLELAGASEVRRFIERDFTFYASWYREIRTAAERWTSGLEAVFRNELSALRDRDDLYLAPLAPGEDRKTSRRKVRTVAAFVEFLVARRVWHGWNHNYETMYGRIEKLIVDVRRRASAAMVDRFSRFQGLGWDFTCGTPPVDGECYDFGRYWPGASAAGGRRRGVHRFLARLTEFIEVESGLPSRFKEYVQTGRDGYDVEHLWAKEHWSRYRDDFEQRDDFHWCRNNIAGLVLLPHVVNVQLSDKAYVKKQAAYGKHSHLDPQRRPENLLARSLAIEPAEEPGFHRFVRRSGLPFRRHAEFRLADLQARGRLYGQLAKQIWSIDNIREVASS